MRADVLAFARDAHRDQCYKGNIPYWLHLRRVARLLELAFDQTCETYGEDLISAAILHDIIEDTVVTLEGISERFGKGVARVVQELTDEQSERAQSPAYLDQMQRASEEVRLIKLADLVDNREL